MNLYIFINLLEFMTYNIETFAFLPTIVGIPKAITQNKMINRHTTATLFRKVILISCPKVFLDG